MPPSIRKWNSQNMGKDKLKIVYIPNIMTKKMVEETLDLKVEMLDW